MLTNESILILLKLVLAHIIGDFIIQPKSWVEDRKTKHIRSKWLHIHSLIQAVLTYIMICQWDKWLIIPIIYVSHMLIDLYKSYKKNHLVLWLVLDQLAHVVALILIWHCVMNYSWINIGPYIWDNKTFLSTLIAYILVTSPTSILISTFIDAWKPNFKEENKGLDNAGNWIGYIERTIVLTFIIIGKYEAIGYLLAAKSIFRLGNMQGEDHKKAEYILVGSFLSFGSAILIGYLLSYYFK